MHLTAGLLVVVSKHSIPNYLTRSTSSLREVACVRRFLATGGGRVIMSQSRGPRVRDRDGGGIAECRCGGDAASCGGLNRACEYLQHRSMQGTRIPGRVKRLRPGEAMASRPLVR